MHVYLKLKKTRNSLRSKKREQTFDLQYKSRNHFKGETEGGEGRGEGKCFASSLYQKHHEFVFSSEGTSVLLNTWPVWPIVLIIVFRHSKLVCKGASSLILPSRCKRYSSSCLYLDLVLVSVLGLSSFLASSSFASASSLENSTNDHTPVPLNVSLAPRAYCARSKVLLIDQ